MTQEKLWPPPSVYIHLGQTPTPVVAFPCELLRDVLLARCLTHVVKGRGMGGPSAGENKHRYKIQTVSQSREGMQATAAIAQLRLGHTTPPTSVS
ncbi:hypothetical protein E2C01_049704 [Portunus trituberculatus]|uniref:Uncharacterized protein n=1 Tax=Portunus trituberculatus TaxID=210409 RepID=A0A5B7G740_PORTR|nr:hypothetical protein [Portunus trituberculatus]